MLDKENFLRLFDNNVAAYKIYEAIKKALEYEIPINTEIFLSEDLWKKIDKKFYQLNVSMIGIDKKQVCFYPNNFDPFFEYEVLAIKINNKFKNYTHKDFLGSIMALNIKRELIGDIFVINNIGYVYVSKKIDDYIINNLKEIGKNKCVVSISDKRDFNYEYKILNISIFSNRLDLFVSSLLNISRNKALEFINNSLVLVDNKIIKDKSYELEEKKLLTIRKKGKFLINKKLKNNKKNKEIWEVLRYI